MINLFQFFILLLAFHILLVFVACLLAQKMQSMVIILKFLGLIPAIFAWTAMTIQYLGDVGSVSERQLLANCIISFWSVNLVFYNGKLKEAVAGYLVNKELIILGNSNLNKIKTLIIFSCSQVIVFFPIISLNYLSGNILLNSLDLIGLVICAISLLMNALASMQLSSYKVISLKPMTYRKGLWGKTRHPDLLGHVICWWGIYLLAFSSTGGAWSILGTIILSFLYLKVFAYKIEDNLLQKLSDYESYQLSTPRIIPNIKT